MDAPPLLAQLHRLGLHHHGLVNRFLIALGLLVALSALGLAAEYLLPYRPAPSEAIDWVLANAPRTYTSPHPDPTQKRLVVAETRNTTIIETIERVPRAVLVIFSHEKFLDGVENNRCITAFYATRRWLSGLHPVALVPTSCYYLLSPLSFDYQDGVMRGTYLLVGVAGDERIASVRGMWSDGHLTNVPVQDERFFFFREEDDLHIEWVMGVDAEGRELPETRMDNRTGP